MARDTSDAFEGGPTYLLLPGVPTDSRTFRHLLPRLPEGRARLHDYPGYGARSAEPLVSTDEMLIDLRRATESLSGPITLVANSFGTILAARICADPHVDIARCVLFAGLGRLSEEMAGARRALLQQLDAGTLSTEQLTEAVMQMMMPSHPEQQVEFERMAASLSRASWRHSAVVALQNGPNAEPLAEFSTPGVVVQGERDAAVPLDCAQEVLAAGANLRLERLDTDSHLVPLTHPELSARIIVEGEGGK